MTRADASGYDHTITGLLRKRADLFAEADRLRDRAAEIRNDVSALDRTLGSLGYAGDLDAAMPRRRREVMFGQGELTRALLCELQDTEGPLSSRDLARAVLALRGDDARDRKLLGEVVKRVSKALRAQRDEGRVRSAVDRLGNLLWSRRAGAGDVVVSSIPGGASPRT